MSRPMAIVYQQPEGGILWLGSMRAARNFALLEHIGINTVISVCMGVRIKYPPEINYIVVEAPDDPKFQLSQNFELVYQEISQGLMTGSVLIECQTGTSRSPALAIAFLMKRMSWMVGQAHRWVHERRPNIEINQGFMQQLANYSYQLQRTRGKRSQSMMSMNDPQNVSYDTSLNSDSTIDMYGSQNLHKLTPIKVVDDQLHRSAVAKVKPLRMQNGFGKILEEETPQETTKNRNFFGARK